MKIKYHNTQHPLVNYKPKVLFDIKWECPEHWQMCVLRNGNGSVTHWL